MLLGDCLVALPGLVLVLHDVLLLELAHTLDFIQVNNEAVIVPVQRLYTLTAEDIQMIGAVEVLDSFWMNFTELLRQGVLIFILEVKACTCENRVFGNNLVQDVYVEREAFRTFKIFNEFTADGAPNAVFVVQLLNAIGTKCVSTMDQYARNTFTHVILHATELADIQLTRLIVEIHHIDSHVSG